MINEKLDRFKEVMDQVIYSDTKADAKYPLMQLESLALELSRDVDGYLSGKLREVVNASKLASGRVQDKEHWKNVASSSWYVFESDVRDHSKDD